MWTTGRTRAPKFGLVCLYTFGRVDEEGGAADGTGLPSEAAEKVDLDAVFASLGQQVLDGVGAIAVILEVNVNKV